MLVPVNKVTFSLNHARKRLLYTCDWSCIDGCRHRISMESCGRNTKTLALIAGSPFPFPFCAFLPPLPFLHLPRLLFSFALLFASILSCFLLHRLLYDKQFLHKLQNVNIRKAHGPDNITSREMKMVYLGFSHCIANINRMSLRTPYILVNGRSAKLLKEKFA